MSDATNGGSGRLRLSAGLIGTGLAIEAATLFWVHPTSFLVCLLAGGLLVGAGVAVYLLSLLRDESSRDGSSRDGKARG